MTGRGQPQESQRGARAIIPRPRVLYRAHHERRMQAAQDRFAIRVNHGAVAARSAWWLAEAPPSR